MKRGVLLGISLALLTVCVVAGAVLADSPPPRWILKECGDRVLEITNGPIQLPHFASSSGNNPLCYVLEAPDGSVIELQVFSCLGFPSCGHTLCPPSYSVTVVEQREPNGDFSWWYIALVSTFVLGLAVGMTFMYFKKNKA